MKEPLVGGDVLANYGTRELIKFVVVDVSEYRDIPQRGSLIGRTPFGPLPLSAHDVLLFVYRPATRTPETRSVSGHLLPRRVGSSADVAAEIAIPGWTH
jgi:hypothetical protein